MVKAGKASLLCHRARAGLNIAVETKLRGDNGPFSVAGNTCLVSAPADIRSKVIENYSVRLIFVDQLDITWEIIYLFLSVGAFAAGIINPYIEDIAVPGQKLGQLIADIIIVLRSSILF